MEISQLEEKQILCGKGRYKSKDIAKIGTLELKIKVEEFPYQQRVKEMEANLHLYKSKVYDIVNVLTI